MGAPALDGESWTGLGRSDTPVGTTVDRVMGKAFC